MINSKYVTIDTIMERAKKNLPPSVDINIEDVAEYIWEALTKIGALQVYVTLYSILKVENYKTQLPSWLYQLNQVRYLTSDITLYDDEDALLSTPLSGYEMDVTLRGFDSSETTNNMGRNIGWRYVVKDNYIHTTFEEGIIEVSYEAMPMDTAGMPLVPQDIYFIEAVVWYITYKYCWRLFVREEGYDTIFLKAEAEWLHYCNAASSKAKIPGKDEFIALYSKHLRILPNLHRNTRYTYYTDPIFTSTDINSVIPQIYGTSS